MEAGFGPRSYASAAWQTKTETKQQLLMSTILFHDVSQPTLLRTTRFNTPRPSYFLRFLIDMQKRAGERKWRIMEVLSEAEIKRMFVENWNNLIYFRSLFSFIFGIEIRLREGNTKDSQLEAFCERERNIILPLLKNQEVKCFYIYSTSIKEKIRNLLFKEMPWEQMIWA